MVAGKVHTCLDNVVWVLSIWYSPTAVMCGHAASTSLSVGGGLMVWSGEREAVAKLREACVAARLPQSRWRLE
eukprot:6591845-Prymnesium_polylepis.1